MQILEISTMYNLHLFGGLNETCALRLDYTIEYRKLTAALDKTICEGEEVLVGDTVYRTSGTFVKTINRSNVCDSIVTLKLMGNAVPKYSQTISICKGGSFAVGDTVYSTAGNYVRNIPQNTGCDSTVITDLHVIPLKLSVTPNVTITQGDSVELQALVQPAGSYNFLWKDDSSLSCPQCAATWAKPRVSTQYALTVSDTGNICHREALLEVVVRPCGIFIPDAFSPNQDGYNEVFFVYGNICVGKIREMKIFNRWGEVIFHKQNFAASDPALGWQGTYRGILSAAGVYPYKIQVELKDGNIVDYDGVVNLLR